MAVLTTPNLTLTKLVDGFSFSVKLAVLPDGTFLVTEKNTGFVRRVDTEFQLQAYPVLDVPVNQASERGLLGIALHPEFVRNRYVYISYVPTISGQDSEDRQDASELRVSRFQLDHHGGAGPLETIVTLTARPGPYHNGGCLLFGPDGKLYLSLGELNRHANIVSQLKGNPRGKILRYNDDGSIPADNPFGTGNPIVVYGLRNAFGFAVEAQGNRLLVSDNGARGHDELSLALPGDNLGWPLIWGVADTWYERLAAGVLGRRYRSPMWESFQKNMTPTAVQVMPNNMYGPGMAGRVLMAGFGFGEIDVLQFALDDQTRSIVMAQGPFIEDLPRIGDLQFDASGRLYILTTDALYRAEPITP